MWPTAGSGPSVTIRLECSHSAQPRRYTDCPSRVVSSRPRTSIIQRTVSSGLGETSSTWASCDSRTSDTGVLPQTRISVLIRGLYQVARRGGGQLDDVRLVRDLALGLERRPVRDAPRQRAVHEAVGDVDGQLRVGMAQLVAVREQRPLEGAGELAGALGAAPPDLRIDLRAVHEHAQHRGIAEHRVSHLAHERLDQLARRQAGPVRGRLEPGVLRREPLHLALVDGEEQGLLARSARVDRADRDAGAPAHLLQREPLEPSLLQHLETGLQHPLQRLLTAALLRRADEGLLRSIAHRARLAYRLCAMSRKVDRTSQSM